VKLSGQDRGKEFENENRLEFLIDRIDSGTSLTVPDHVYGLGGAGGRMVLETFHQDWFVVEAITGRRNNVKVHLIDTATGEEGSIQSEVDTLEDRIENIRQECRDQLPSDVSISSIEFSVYNINSEISINSFTDLTGDKIVKQILSEESLDVDNWWVERDHLQSQNDSSSLFRVSKGVIKRRSLSKALHYKSRVRGSREYSDEFKTDRDGNRVAIFSSLGGGTGSGLSVEVANEVYDQNDTAEINLFSTMPAPNEKELSLRNAYAALSELEYMALEDSVRNPFNQIFLFSLEPTGHSSGKIETKNVLEFDATIPYALASIYNEAPDLALQQTKSYAPFTTVVPQVLHYRRDEVKQAKDETEQLFKSKHRSINKEFTVLERVEEYVSDNYSPINTADISADDLDRQARQHLKDRIRTVVELLQFDIVSHLDFEVNRSDRIVDNIYGEFDVTGKDIEDVFAHRSLDDIIGTFGRHYRAEGYGEDGQIDEYTTLSESFVEDLVYHELHRIDRLCRLYKEIHLIDRQKGTDLYKRVLNALTVPNADSDSAVEDLETRIEEQRQQVNDVEKRISNAEESLQEERDSSDDSVDSQYDEWRRSVREEIDDYVALQEWDVKDQMKRLSRELSNFLDDLDEPDASGIERVLRETLESAPKLESRDEDELKRRTRKWKEDIVEEVEQLPRARRKWNELEDELNDDSILDRIRPGEQELDITRYTEIRTGIDGVFDPPRGTMKSAFERHTFDNRVSVDYDIDEDSLYQWVERLRQSLKESIEDAYRQKWREVADDRESGTPSDIEHQIETLQRPAAEDPLESTVKDAFREVSGSRVVELEEKLNRLESELIEEISQKDALEALSELYFDNTDFVETVEEQLDEFESGLDTTSMVSQQSARQKSTAEEHSFRHEIELKDERTIVNAIQNSSLAQLLEDEASSGGRSKLRGRLSDKLNDFIGENIISNDYCGIDRRRLKLDGHGDYEDVGAYVSFVGDVFGQSRQRGIDSEELGKIAEEKVMKNFVPNDAQTNYDKWVVSSSHPWQVGVIGFYQGMTMLDNLRPVVTGGRGYRDQYLKSGSPGERVVRHSRGLERGRFNWREDRVDTGQPRLFFDEDDTVIQARIRDCHEVAHFDEETESWEWETEE
jgi:hypothetical protein